MVTFVGCASQVRRVDYHGVFPMSDDASTMESEKVEYYSDGERNCTFIDGEFEEGDEQYAEEIEEMKAIVYDNDE